MFPMPQVPNVLGAGTETLVGSKYWIYAGVFVAAFAGTYWLRTLIGPLQSGTPDRVWGSTPLVLEVLPPTPQPPKLLSVRALPVCRVMMPPTSQFPTMALTTGFRSLPNCLPRPTGS